MDPSVAADFPGLGDVLSAVLDRDVDARAGLEGVLVVDHFEVAGFVVRGVGVGIVDNWGGRSTRSVIGSGGGGGEVAYTRFRRSVCA